MNKKVCIGLTLLLVFLKCVAIQSKEHPIIYSPNNMIWGIEALYFKPDNIQVNAATTTISSSFLSLDIDTIFNWGFQLSGDYLFNDGKNSKFEWIHYNNTQNNERLQVDELKGEGATSVPYGYVSRFDILNLELGEWIDLHNGFAYRLHGGLEYAYLRTSHHFNYVTNNSGSSQSLQSGYVYYSVGARAGVDLNYKFTKKIQMDIESAIALLDRNGRYNKVNHLINRTPAGAIISRADINENSKLQGGLVGLDTYLSLSYKNQMLSNGKLLLHGGVRTIVFMQESMKWGGGFIGAQWIGQI